MKIMKPLRLIGAATFLSVSTLAVAQSTAPAPSSPPAEKPPMAKPETAPAPAPQAQPAPAPQPSAKPSAATTTHPMVGKTVLLSDGSKAGDVRAVKADATGKITAIQLKVGGFLGFGGKIVEVSDGKFTQKGDTIQLAYTSDELSKLPEVKDAS